MDSEVLSVGIDIGTSTTQVIFSKLKMENTAAYFAVPKVSIVKKDVVYKSPVYMTPLLDESLIDGERIKNIVSSEFEKAGYSPNDTDTGAVIITGESARKENAALVLEKLSGFAGDFVVSTAGPDLESIIAGKGSGAQQYSEENACTAVNLDIGGGTTNIVLFDCGETVAKGCFDIGGRQVRLSDDMTVEYISPSAKKICKEYYIPIEEGKKTDEKTLTALCSAMAQLLEQAVGIGERTKLLDEIETSGSSFFKIDKPIKAICFSGGVADCVYKSDFSDIQYGDIGVLLGRAIRNGKFFSSFKTIIPRETIRATVVGAGTYTTSISGSTITYSENILPIKNVPVMRLGEEEQARCFGGDSDFLKEKAKWFLGQNDTDKMILSMRGSTNPSYSEIKMLASCIAEAMDSVLTEDSPLLLVVECDMAKALGRAVKNILGEKRSVISIDGIKADLNDYIDLGTPVMNGLVIPVVVKTLIFG